MRLALLVTARCNASCTHCTTDSGPHKTTGLGSEQIRRLMCEAAAIREAGEPLLFCISGGEPFTDFRKLVDMVAYGTDLGGQVTCTTNGYWASSDDKARSMLTALKEAGLHALGVSTSRFHQQFIRPERVGRALTIAGGLGIRTTLKCALTAADEREGWADRYAEAWRPGAIEKFPVVPYLRRGAELPDQDYSRRPGLPEGTCPASILTVREDGAAYTCCNPGGFADLLALGNAVSQGLADTRDRHLRQGQQQILRRYGPIHFAQKAIASGLGDRLRPAYGDVCDLCGHIASDPVLAAAAQAAADEFERNQMRELFDDLWRETPRRRKPRPQRRRAAAKNP